MVKNNYSSKYTDKPVSAEQFLCDCIMERIAAKDGKVLPYKYWNVPAWNKQYRRQIAEATKLLKQLKLTHVMAFLRSKAGQKIYSLGVWSKICEGARKFITVYTSEEDQKKEDNGIIVDQFIDDFDTAPDEVVIDVSKGKTQWELLNG